MRQNGRAADHAAVQQYSDGRLSGRRDLRAAGSKENAGCPYFGPFDRLRHHI